MIAQLILFCSGLGVGIFVAYSILKILKLQSDIDNIYDEFENSKSYIDEKVESTIKSIPTPEELAIEIAKVKLPLDKLPPELISQLKEEATEISKSKKYNSITGKNSYMG